MICVLISSFVSPTKGGWFRFSRSCSVTRITSSATDGSTDFSSLQKNEYYFRAIITIYNRVEVLRFFVYLYISKQRLNYSTFFSEWGVNGFLIKEPSDKGRIKKITRVMVFYTFCFTSCLWSCFFLESKTYHVLYYLHYFCAILNLDSFNQLLLETFAFMVEVQTKAV